MNTYIKILSAALLVSSTSSVFASDDAVDSADTHQATGTVAASLTVPTVLADASTSHAATVHATKPSDAAITTALAVLTVESTTGGATGATLASSSGMPAHDSDDDGADEAATASTHAVVTSNVPTASSAATAVETDAEFATRVLTKFPGLTPAQYINDHHKVLFDGKATLKLAAVRARLEAGILALTSAE